MTVFDSAWMVVKEENEWGGDYRGYIWEIMADSAPAGKSGRPLLTYHIYDNTGQMWSNPGRPGRQYWTVEEARNSAKNDIDLLVDGNTLKPPGWRENSLNAHHHKHPRSRDAPRGDHLSNIGYVEHETNAQRSSKLREWIEEYKSRRSPEENAINEVMAHMESKPDDICQVCDADLTEEKNLSPPQYREMLEYGVFPEICINCSNEMNYGHGD